LHQRQLIYLLAELPKITKPISFSQNKPLDRVMVTDLRLGRGIAILCMNVYIYISLGVYLISG